MTQKIRRERIGVEYIYFEKEVNAETGALRFLDLIAVGKDGKNYKAVGLYCGGVPVIGWKEVDLTVSHEDNVEQI